MAVDLVLGNCGIDDKIFDESFTRAMGFLGIKYRIEKVGGAFRFKITDLSRLEKGMEQFR